MPTQDEIIARIKEKRAEPLSFEPEVLLSHLDFAGAREFVKASTTPDEWQKVVEERRAPLDEAKEYMARIGWPKVLGHRGISAGRTIDKMTAWAFLADDEVALHIIKDTPYPQYGAPILRALCRHWGFEIPADEASARMADGLKCEPGCSGCGR